MTHIRLLASFLTLAVLGGCAGTIQDVEPLHGDMKLTVRFSGVGSKKLLARYAKLQPV